MSLKIKSNFSTSLAAINTREKKGDDQSGLKLINLYLM